MVARNYPACLTETLKWEGGLSNHPDDPGGLTNRGVTQAVYAAYRSKKGLAVISVAHLSEQELQEIYRRNYWDKVSGDTLNHGVDLATFDYAVNSGPGRAKPALERALRATPEATIKALCAARLSFVRGLRTFASFGKGWTRRITGIEARAVRMYYEGMGMPATVVADRLTTSQKQASRTATQQTGGAAAGTGGAAVTTDFSSFGGLLVAVAIFALAGFLFYRVVINRQRASAYKEQASQVIGNALTGAPR